MTADIAALCIAQGWHPQTIIGHSAGAAVALSLTEILNPSPTVIGINAALGRFDGVAGWLFPLLAKLLALNPLTAFAFTMGRDPMSRARRLIESTGSTLSEEGLSYYARLISDRAHVDGTLKMMSQWNVDRLDDALPQITSPCLLITAENDSAVAPHISRVAAERMPNAIYMELPELGHLAHEEAPAQITRMITDWLAEHS
jgi:magnesium chelatase accessory protein